MSESESDIPQLLSKCSRLWRRAAGKSSNSQNVVHIFRDCRHLDDDPDSVRKLTVEAELPLRPGLCNRCEARFSDPIQLNQAVVVVGLPGAGKTEAGEFAATALDSAHVIETGGVVRRGAAQFYQADVEDLTSDQLGEYSTMRRNRDGGDYVARDVIETLEGDAGADQPTVIIGMRDTEALPVLEDYFERLQIVWVHAPHDVRLQRLQDRDRQDEANFTSEDLCRRDGRESMWGTPEWAFHADARILNTGTLEHLRERIETEVGG